MEVNLWCDCRGEYHWQHEDSCGGSLPKSRLLEYVRDFVVFEQANDVITKKGAKYHQFFAVRLAVKRPSRRSRNELIAGLVSFGTRRVPASLCRWPFWLASFAVSLPSRTRP